MLRRDIASAVRPGANASRCTVFVRIPQESALNRPFYASAACRRAFSCGIRTKTVAEGSPWPDSRNDVSRNLSVKSVKSVAVFVLVFVQQLILCVFEYVTVIKKSYTKRTNL